MSKFDRMIDVLDLYSEDVTLLTAEDVAEKLQISRPTAFRYMRELNAVGFLANYSGRYSLGARIITLDRRIRASDPILKEAMPAMHTLAQETNCSAILCRMYNEDIIRVHHEAPHHSEAIDFALRGSPLPLLRGAGSKTMLAFLPLARLRKIHERHAHEPDAQAIAADWNGFKAYFQRIRQCGHYLSNQEVNQGTVGLAAPIFLPRLGPVAVISLVFSVERLALVNTDGLASALKTCSKEIAAHLRLQPASA